MGVILAVLIFAGPDPAVFQQLQVGAFAQARDALLAKRQSGVWDLDDQLTLAAACLALEDLGCAELLYRETLEPVPRHALALFGLAEIRRLQGNYKAARGLFTDYLASTLPGRTAGYDDVARARIAALERAGDAAAGFAARPLGRPPTFSALAWTSLRWSSLAFFPAFLAGAISFGIANEVVRGSDALAVLGAFSVGVGVYGGMVAYGVDRAARRRGYTGATLNAGIAAAVVPFAAFGGLALMIETNAMDGDLAPLIFIGVLSAGMAFAPAAVYLRDLRPIGAEAGTGSPSGQVPSVVYE
jgi:hypothetical protein